MLRFELGLVFVVCLAQMVVCMTNKNVFNETLEVCSLSPMTGWIRNGKCETFKDDSGTHLVCATMTDDFLDYTKSKGNDLSTPTSFFPGLKQGDNWCICVIRWNQAKNDGHAPKVVREATNLATLKFLKGFNKSIDDLQ